MAVGFGVSTPEHVQQVNHSCHLLLSTLSGVVSYCRSFDTLVASFIVLFRLQGGAQMV